MRIEVLLIIVSVIVLSIITYGQFRQSRSENDWGDDE